MGVFFFTSNLNINVPEKYLEKIFKDTTNADNFADAEKMFLKKKVLMFAGTQKQLIV